MVAGSMYFACFARVSRLSALAGARVFVVLMSSSTARGRGHAPLPRHFSSEPPRNDHLLVRVELVGIAPVRLEIPEEAVLGPAERELRHRRRDADVHADHGRRREACVLPRRLAAGS